MNDSRLLRWLYGVIGVIVILAIVIAVLEARMNKVPSVRIPRPIMPYPNAYDFYVKAGKALLEKEKVEYAISEDPHPSPAPMPPPPNPTQPPQAAPPIASSPLDRDYSLAEKEALLKANVQVLSLVRQAFSYEYLNPPGRSFNATYPVFPQFRYIARLLVLESQVKAGHGDWEGAMDSCIDALRMGQDVPRGGQLIAALVGKATQKIGRQSAWKIVDRLNAQQARRAIKRMEDILARNVPFADTLQEDKWYIQASLVEMFRQPGWRSWLSATLAGSTCSGPTSDIVQKLKSFTWSKGRTLRLYSAYMDQLIAYNRLPYPAMSKQHPKVPKDDMCRILCPVYDKARISITNGETQNALLTIKLALRAYRLEHGQYPSTLSELNGSYLKRIPDDPFALKGPPRYKRVGDKYLLYSVGPDCKDNGGKAIFDKSQAPYASSPPSRRRQRYMVFPDSKGDIVAGVNTL